MFGFHVCSQRHFLFESHRAKLAQVWLLAGVDSDVGFQRVGAGQAFVTIGTGCWPFTRMHLHVLFKAVVAIESLIAMRTFYLLLFGY